MGPLFGIRIIELASLGPGPFCGMMLGDMGADVIRIDRLQDDPLQTLDPLCRNRRSLALDLKSPDGVEALMRLVESADGLFEGYRPGVAERLGVGPDACMKRNAKLVYGRVTGWGRDGPLASAAGHDINFVAMSGALHAIGPGGGTPCPPLNLVGDFGGGGMQLAFGMVCALLEASRTGRGQVVDAAMIDGAAALMGSYYGFREMGLFDGGTGTHFLAGAAHFYGVYATKDDKFVSIGPLEPQFYEALIDKLGLDPERFSGERFSLTPGEMDTGKWPELKEELAAVFKTRTRNEWCEILEGTDVCFAPVLSSAEAAEHPHNVSRGTFVTVDGVRQHAPTPRFGRTATRAPDPPPSTGRHSREVLAEAGFTPQEIDEMVERGVLRQAD